MIFLLPQTHIQVHLNHNVQWFSTKADFALPQSTFGNVLVVTTQDGECYWNLVGKDLGCYQTVPHNKELLAPSVHNAEVKTC